MLRKFIITSLLLLPGYASAICVHNDTDKKIRVVFNESVGVSADRLLQTQGIKDKVILTPQEEYCIPGAHPRIQGAYSIAFQPIKNINDSDRQNNPNPIFYFLERPVPPNANVSIQLKSWNPKVSVTNGKQPFHYGKLLQAKAPAKAE